MHDNGIEELITKLYDMVQDARSLPLGADKCIVERDKVLDMLDEISNQLPGELKQAKTIVDSRNELIAKAKREAEGLVRQAQAQAKQLVSQEATYKEAQAHAEVKSGSPAAASASWSAPRIGLRPPLLRICNTRLSVPLYKDSILSLKGDLYAPSIQN